MAPSWLPKSIQTRENIDAGASFNNTETEFLKLNTPMLSSCVIFCNHTETQHMHSVIASQQGVFYFELRKQKFKKFEKANKNKRNEES